MSKIKKEVLPEGFEVKDLTDVAWKSLCQMFKSVEGRNITPEDLPKWKMTLGLINATNGTIKTSMQCFKLSSLPQAVAMVKKAVKKRKY